MKHYILALFPPEFSRNPAYWRGFALGLVMIALALTQLFQFEDFPGVIEAMRLPGGAGLAGLLAALFPLLEIASVPYLCSIKVSPVVREVSKWAGLAVGVLWVVVTVWTSLTLGATVYSGIFGATLMASSGWWSVLFAVLLLWSQVLTMRELPKRRAS